jgi:hypothetical protein
MLAVWLFVLFAAILRVVPLHLPAGNLALVLGGFCMGSVDALKSLITDAFAHVEYPGDHCLRGSSEGDEPYLLELEFKGRSDWRVLDPNFIDQAPDGFGTALSFFSDEAFHFYLPAYLLADIDGLLERHDPVFHLTHGLTDAEYGEKINPRRYGERTWFDHARHKFAILTRREAAAIVAYLTYKREDCDLDQERIDQALQNFWLNRAAT